MSKQVTPQAISAVLRKAGFERMVITRNARHNKQHTAGYVVRRYMDEVTVHYWHDSSLQNQMAATLQDRIAEKRQMQAKYANVLRLHGWEVDERLDRVIVTGVKP